MLALVPLHGSFICDCCGTHTNRLDVDYEEHGEPVYECCECGGDYVEAVECAYCGAIIAESDAYLDEDGDYMCDKCETKLFWEAEKG